jgi:putative phosphoribosyl transferase
MLQSTYLAQPHRPAQLPASRRRGALAHGRLECHACIEITIMTSLQQLLIHDASLLEADSEYVHVCTAAGRLLAERLQPFRGRRAIEQAMMPGGQAIAQEIARVLRLPQDILVARELHVHPYPEVVAGGISEGSGLCINRAALRLPGMSALAIWAEAYIVRDEVALLVQQYRAGRPLPACSRRSVILVDDRLGSGLTQLAAIQSLRRLHPQQCIVAVRSAEEMALQQITRQADVVIALEVEGVSHA